MLTLAAFAAFAVVLVPSGSAKPPSPIGTYQACLIAGDGSAGCTPTATGGDYSVLTGSNPELQVTIKNDTTSNQTLDYANVTVPPGIIGLGIDTAHSPQPASYTTYASTSTASTLQLRGLGLAPGASRTIAFFVNAPTSSCTDGIWATEARSSSTPSAFVFTNPPSKAGGLTSLVSANCTLSFQTGPSAALPNNTITGSPYNPSGTTVTVATQSLPVALNGGGVTLSVGTGSFETGTDSFTGTGPVALSSGSAAFGSLKATGTGGPFTLKASAAGFNDAVSSPPFAITKNGTVCDSGGICTLTGTDPNGKTLTQIATSAGFGFVGTSPTEVPFNPVPAGCQPWSPTPNVSGFAEFDGRTADGTMTITYLIPQNAIKARYGKNVGQQFIPICIGAKTIDPVTHQPQDCSAPGDLGWTGDQLDPATGAFTGQPAQAMCGPGGYWWGIISSFQDKLDQSVNPVVTAWSSPTIGGTTYRAFVISVPSNLDMQGHG